MEKENIVCPKCGINTNQQRYGVTGAGSQRYICGKCAKRYTPNKKKWAYSESEKELAVRAYYMSGSGRGVGKIMKMHHSNVLRWIIKKPM